MIEEIERFNILAEELRKLDAKLDKVIYRQGLMETAANDRYTSVVQLNYGVKGLIEGQQAVLEWQKRRDKRREKKRKKR